MQNNNDTINNNNGVPDQIETANNNGVDPGFLTQDTLNTNPTLRSPSGASVASVPTAGTPNTPAPSQGTALVTSATNSVVKASPFAKRNLKEELSSSSKKRRTEPIYAQIIRVETDCPDMCGFAVIVDSYCDEVMTQPLYDRREQTHIEYIAAISPILRVFNIKAKNGDGLRMRPSTGHKYKTLIMKCPKDTPDELIVTWFNDTFRPAILRLNQLFEGTVPQLKDPTEEPFELHTCWDTLLTKSNWMWVLRDHLNSLKPKMQMSVFFKMHKDNYTAVWGKGNITANDIETYGLKQANLYPEDQSKASE